MRWEARPTARPRARRRDRPLTGSALRLDGEVGGPRAQLVELAAIPAARVDRVGQDEHERALIRIDPERRPGEAGVAEAARYEAHPGRGRPGAGLHGPPERAPVGRRPREQLDGLAPEKAAAVRRDPAARQRTREAREVARGGEEARVAGGAAEDVRLQVGPIDADDCAQLANMISAVELRTPPTFCNFPPLLDARTAPTCSSATTSGVTEPIASFNVETDPTDWSVSREAASDSFTPRDWTWVDALPSGRSGSGFYAPTPGTGDCAEQLESGVLHLASPPIAIPTTAVFARATFEHWMSSEAILGVGGVDGGNLKVRVNAGPWQLVPASQFSFNAYNTILLAAEQGNTNPLAGQPGWSGTNQGTVDGGSWGRTHVDLGNFAAPGDTVQLRWDMGTDCSVGRRGWYLDNVNLFSCTPNIPAVSILDAAVAAGDPLRPASVFPIVLSKPTIRAVAVTYETVDGTAVHGKDYEKASGTIVIPASSATQLVGGVSLQIPVMDNPAAAGDSTFTVRIKSVTNATITKGEAIGTISH